MFMREKNPAVLPAGYNELEKIDLQKNKRQMLLVNGIALAIMAVMCVIGHLVVPVTEMFDMEMGVGLYFLRFGVLLAGYAAYIVLHELVHGICMKAFSGVAPKYGFTGMYAYAGSSAYFSRLYYIIIALAPIVVWGVVLAVICPLVPKAWFWVPYFIQVGNIAGAAGDMFVTWKMLHMPADILVNDIGVSMTVYSKQA